MTTVIDRVTEVQDQVISTLAGVKEPISSAVATVVEFVLERRPEVPALPFAEQIPTPKEIIENQAKFASKLVSTNKSVALAAAAAAKPLTDQLLDRPASAARSAKKVAA